MRGRVNDWLRSAIAHSIRVAGVVFSGLLRVRVKRGYKRTLNRRHNGTGGKFAVTSGSAGDPKRILYTSKRLRACKWVFVDMFARACRAFQIRRTSLYVFSSFEPDDSLTSMLLDEADLPNYFATLQAPYRVQRHTAIRTLAAEYGATAVRLWIIAISNPGVLYSTNPSNPLYLLRRPATQLSRELEFDQELVQRSKSLQSKRSQNRAQARFHRQRRTVTNNRYQRNATSDRRLGAGSRGLHLLDRRLRQTVSRSTAKVSSLAPLPPHPDVFHVD